MNKKIAIVGLGTVGQTVYQYFKKKKFQVLGYDKFKKIGSLEDLERAKIIFLCLPTPYQRKTGADISSLKETISFFKKEKIFVIKSTIPPGTTDYFQKIYRKHFFLFNPEFLTEKRAKQEFFNPNLQIVGYTKKSKPLAKKILNLLPKAKFSKIIPAKSAELFKYARNAFFALKVIFANQLYDFCQKEKINYQEVKNCLANDPWIGPMHLEIFHQNYRGFGGKCLPKDLKALIFFFKKAGVSAELFQAVDRINFKLIKAQKLEKIFNDYWLKNKLPNQ